MFSCAALIKDHTQSPDVTFLIVRLALTELWGEIVWGAHQGLSKALRAGENLQGASLSAHTQKPQHVLPWSHDQLLCMQRSNLTNVTMQCWLNTSADFKRCRWSGMMELIKRKMQQHTVLAYCGNAQVCNLDLSVCIKQ